MNLQINIPQEAEHTLREAWGEHLDRAAFEALLAESYRTAKLSLGEVAELLGFETRFQAEKWLGERGVSMNYGIAELEADRRTLTRVMGQPH